nr:reverse transcriptase domain-containing protein [Tanacetum cinerariifolium]
MEGGKYFPRNIFCNLLKCVDRIPWQTIKPSGGMMYQGVREEIHVKGVIGDPIHFDTLGDMQEFVKMLVSDTINAAAGGTFMKKRPEECYDLIENMTAHHNDWDTSILKSESSSSITSSSKQEIPPLAKLRTYLLWEPLIRVVILTNLKGDILLLEEFLNDDPSSPSLPPQELKVVEPTNEKSSIDELPVVELKDLPPLLEYAFLKVKRKTKVTKDTVPPTNNGSTKDVQPSVVQVETPIPNSEPVVAPFVKPIKAPVSAPKPNQKPSIPYPSRLHDQKLRDKTNDKKDKIFKIFQDLDFNIRFADALILMPKFGPTIKREQPRKKPILSKR